LLRRGIFSLKRRKGIKLRKLKHPLIREFKGAQNFSGRAPQAQNPLGEINLGV